MDPGQTLDERYSRAASDSPFRGILDGSSRREDAAAAFGRLWPLLLATSRGLLPRLLREPPSLQIAVRLAPVVGHAYGNGEPANIFTAKFERLVKALGGRLDSSSASDAPSFRGLSHAEALALLLAQRSIGPTVAGRLAAALRKHHGLAAADTAWLDDLDRHGADDCAVILAVISETVPAKDTAAITRRLTESLDSAPLSHLACALGGPVTHSFVRRNR